jgi:parallel beta-helix repeat protein
MTGRKIISISVCIFVILTLIMGIDTHFEITPNARGAVIRVGGSGPGNISTIQGGVDAASPGDTVFVFSGTYKEYVTIDKPLSLLGEDASTTIIDGGGAGIVVTVTADGVVVSGFKVTDCDAGILINSDGNTITGNIFESNTWAIYLDHSSYNLIEGNFCEDNTNMVYLYRAHDNRIIGNSEYMGSCGINMFYSHGNEIYNNTFWRNDNGGNGIHLWRSPENKIMGNVVNGHWQGIYIEESDLNDIVGNDVSDSKFGIRFRNILYNNVIGNTISQCLDYGILLIDSYYNIFHHNNHIDNAKQVYDNTNNGNRWYNCYPAAGNFWSDYNGTDDDGDGIGDTPYCIDPDSFDPYPLMSSYIYPSSPEVDPWADAGQDQVVYANETVHFNGSASIDPFGGIMSHDWDFGDGSPHKTGVHPTHVYQNIGIFTVTLTVHDHDGNIDTDICIIIVCTVFPDADAGDDQWIQMGEMVQFDGSGSSDPDTKWEIETVDAQSRVSGYPSLALDPDGNPHISYKICESPTYTELRYAKNIGDDWTVDTIEQGTSLESSSIAVDENFVPHIGYYEAWDDDLKYVKLNGTVWEIEIADSEGWVGYLPDIVLDSNNRPHISYLNLSYPYEVKYAWYDGNEWFNETVDSGFAPISIDLDSSDIPHMSYFDIDNYDLKYAHRAGGTWTILTVDQQGDVGRSSSLVLDALDYPHISYVDSSNRKLKYAQWNGSSWKIDTIIDVNSHPIGRTSLKIDSRGTPHICFPDAANTDTMYATKIGNEWTVETVDGFMSTFAGLLDTNGPSLALDGEDIPHVAYLETYYEDVKLAWKRGGIISYFWDFGDGSNSTEMNPTHVYNNPGIYTVTLTVTDNQGHSDSDYCIITVGSVLNLHPGWNLISLPGIQNTTNIQTVLHSITGDYDAVQVYENSNGHDPWKSFHISKPDSLNDLEEIDHKDGIYIHITNQNGAALVLNNSRPSSNQSIPLYKGWNMVGYPSQSNKLRPDALYNLVFGIEVDAIWTFNPDSQQWEDVGPSDHFEPGRGYWIHSNIDITWEISTDPPS